MGEIEIDIDTLNKRVIRDIKDAFDDGVESAAGRSSSSGLPDAMEEAAKSKLRSEGAVWTGELISSFGVRYADKGDRIVVIFYNDADHARPVEAGAEYGSEGPPVHALVPWVVTHLDSWSIPDGDQGGLPSPDDLSSEREDVDEELLRVAESVSDDVIEKAFWLQQKIKREGLDAVNFMQTAEEFAEDAGGEVVQTHIERKLTSKNL